MKDEIKEILDNFKDYEKRYKQFNETQFIIFYRDIHLLLDYITNLQEENEEWSIIFDTFSKRPYAHKYLEEKKKELGNNKIIGLDSEMIYKDYYDLKEENERLKELNVCVGCNNNPDYKSRNEQAIRYIERCRDYHRDIHKEERIFPDEITSLLMILNGGDEE